jgi:hypothetical protein
MLRRSSGSLGRALRQFSTESCPATGKTLLSLLYSISWLPLQDVELWRVRQVLLPQRIEFIAQILLSNRIKMAGDIPNDTVQTMKISSKRRIQLQRILNKNSSRSNRTDVVT